MQIIKSRRSCRKFTDDVVSLETLRSLVEAAIWAPTGCNQQEVRFVVTTKTEDLAALQKAKKVINPQAVILIYTDVNSTYYKGWWNDPHKARLQYFDAAAAAMNITLAAESLGLGSLWVNVSPYWCGEHGENVIELYKRFDVPNTLKLQGAVFLGYPAATVDLSVAKWHGRPVMRGPVQDYVVNVPRKMAILHYQSPSHDNMGSRALSEGLLNLARERMGRTHFIRLFSEYPLSRLVNRSYLGDEPDKAVEKFELLTDMLLSRLKHAHVVPDDTFGAYVRRLVFKSCTVCGLYRKVRRRIPIPPRNLNDIYSVKKELGRLRQPAADEMKGLTVRDIPSLLIEPQMRFSERLIARFFPRIFGLRHIEKRLFELARFDTVIYNGDGYIADYYGDALVRRLLELNVAVRLEKEVLACNLSVDVKDEVLRSLVGHVFRRIPRIVVREPLSLEKLVECGVAREKIVVGADAAVYASVEPFGDLGEILDDVTVNLAQCIAIILRGDRGHDAESWAQVVRDLRQRLNLNVVLLSSSLNQDRGLIEDVARLSGAPVMKRRTTHPKFVDLLSRFRLVISERYHPCVFCVRTQTPVVPLSGNTLKTDGLFSLFEYSVEVLNSEASDPKNREAILRAAEHALANSSLLQEELKHGYEVLRKEAEKNLDPMLFTESDELFYH